MLEWLVRPPALLLQDYKGILALPSGSGIYQQNSIWVLQAEASGLLTAVRGKQSWYRNYPDCTAGEACLPSSLTDSWGGLKFVLLR